MGLFNLGMTGNRRGGIEFNLPGQYLARKVNGVDLPYFEGEKARLVSDRWYTVRISVRGKTCQGYIDGNRLVEFGDVPLESGRVGLRISQATFRFRELLVTAPDGSVLWDGLPELPRSPQPIPPEFISILPTNLLPPQRLAVD